MHARALTILGPDTTELYVVTHSGTVIPESSGTRRANDLVADRQSRTCFEFVDPGP
jgi:hypothetical protein